MNDTRLHTIRDIAGELGLPESTVRYYRDAFDAYLPSVGMGRRRRYPAEAIALLRLVAQGYAQNRPRAEIERTLRETLQPGRPVSATFLSLSPRRRDRMDDEVLGILLDGERERREVMWQMARELVRLGEAIERQQTFLNRCAGHLERVARALPAGAPRQGPLPTPTESSTASVAGNGVEAAGGPQGDVARELEDLRQELARERELVERLRRSKLELERRAVAAEARLGEQAGAPPRPGVFGRLLARDTDAPR